MKDTTLDTVHHIAIQVTDIEAAVNWYRQLLKCEVAYQDATWALLKFANLSMALVLPGSHPPHLAITCYSPEQYGEPKAHRDGTSSVYLPDPFGYKRSHKI
jgi:catechol 2,3-dioxygenase-like lactoylglutathione lyase family enzyme